MISDTSEPRASMLGLNEDKDKTCFIIVYKVYNENIYWPNEYLHSS